MVKWFILGGAVLAVGYVVLRSRAAQAAPAAMPPNFAAGTTAAMGPPKMVVPSRGAQIGSTVGAYLGGGTGGAIGSAVGGAVGSVLSSTFSGISITDGANCLAYYARAYAQRTNPAWRAPSTGLSAKAEMDRLFKKCGPKWTTSPEKHAANMAA